jgi:hypothetical protein
MLRKTLGRIEKILNLLKSLDTEIHIRGISKILDMYPTTVNRIIENYLDLFVNIRIVDQYGFKAKLVKLKSDKLNTNLTDVLRYYRVKKRIKR